jgi:predicted glycosyltransferase
MKEEKVLKYHALDPWAWLRASKIRATSSVKGRVLIRLEEWFASYFRKGLGVSDVVSKLVEGINKVGDYEITLVPRYDDQRRWAIKKFGKTCIVPKTTINGPEAIANTDLLIGGGATMTQEAALLGVPNISYFPSAKLDVFSNYYFPRKLSIEASNPKELLSSTFSLLKEIDKEKPRFMERASRETRNFEDPVKFVFARISGRAQ